MAGKQIVVDVVLKAAEMPKPTSAATFLASAALYTVFMTCSNAVSVECPRRYADCSRVKFGDESRCGHSLCSTSRLITFKMIVRLDIGRFDQKS